MAITSQPYSLSYFGKYCTSQMQFCCVIIRLYLNHCLTVSFKMYLCKYCRKALCQVQVLSTSSFFPAGGPAAVDWWLRTPPADGWPGVLSYDVRHVSGRPDVAGGRLGGGGGLSRGLRPTGPLARRQVTMWLGGRANRKRHSLLDSCHIERRPTAASSAVTMPEPASSEEYSFCF